MRFTRSRAGGSRRPAHRAVAVPSSKPGGRNETICRMDRRDDARRRRDRGGAERPGSDRRAGRAVGHPARCRAPTSTMASGWRCKEINASGGILGRKIDYTYNDTQSNPGVAKALAQKAVDQDAYVVMGPVFSGSIIVSMDETRKAEITNFTGGEAANITQQGNPYIFRTSFTQANAMPQGGALHEERAEGEDRRRSSGSTTTSARAATTSSSRRSTPRGSRSAPTSRPTRARSISPAPC